jgi:hypothetical protein
MQYMPRNTLLATDWSGGTLNTWRSGDDGRTVAERLQVEPKQYVPGLRDTVGEKDAANVLATLRRTPSIAGYIHTGPARCAVHRMG